MNLRSLRDIIRAEAGIIGLDTLSGIIDITINEIIRTKTSLSRYRELFVPNEQILSNNPNFWEFSLPSDLQHFLPERVRFVDDVADGIDASMQLYSAPFLGDIEGSPRMYNLVGNLVTLWPQTVESTGAIYIDYYKAHTPLEEESDEFPIPSIENAVKLEVISRMTRHSSSKFGREFKANAREAQNSADAIR